MTDAPHGGIMRIANVRIVAGLLILAAGLSAESADSQPGRKDLPPQGTPAKSTASPPAPKRDDFAARQQRLQQQQTWQQRSQEANRPTTWQMQNPSNPQNNSPTDPKVNGYIAPNTYFGAEFREWHNQSPTVTQNQPPSNISPSLPLMQSNAMIAPNSYWGADNARWSNMTIVNPQPSPFGSWTIRSGW